MSKIKKNINVGSLFAGVGGFDLGLVSTEHETKMFKISFANEIDKYASHTYRENFKNDLIEGNLEYILSPENSDNQEYYNKMRNIMFKDNIDVLTGGFPCQSFSIAGNQKGFNDDRGNLFWSIIETINQMDEYSSKPRVLFLENVKNLKSHDKGKTYEIIKHEIESLGYTIKDAIINTMDYSFLPQNRERIYILAFLNSEDAEKFTLFDNLEKYKINIDDNKRIKLIRDLIDDNINSIDNNDLYYNKDKYPNYFQENGINLESSITEKYQFYQLRRGMYVRKNMSNVCPTLTANMGTGGHNVPIILVNDGIRKLSPKETFELQGFTEKLGYKLPNKFNNRPYAKGHLYKQAGNAVSVDIIKLISNQLIKIL